MTSHTNSNSYKTTYNLDGYGNVTEEDDPPTSAGTRVTKYTYTFPPDASSIGQLPGGLVSVETDAAETSKPTTTTTQYVASGNQVGLVQTVTVSQGGGSYTLTYQYDGNRNLTQSTDQYNHVTKYTYDKLNNLLSQTDPAADGGSNTGPVTTYTYDAAGNQISVTDPDGNETDNQYDGMNRLVKVTAPAPDVNAADADATLSLTSGVPGGLADDEDSSEITKYAYDADGNQVSVTDPQGRVTTSKYDAQRVLRNGPARSRRERDARGNVLRGDGRAEDLVLLRYAGRTGLHDRSGQRSHRVRVRRDPAEDRNADAGPQQRGRPDDYLPI